MMHIRLANRKDNLTKKRKSNNNNTNPYICQTQQLYKVYNGQKLQIKKRRPTVFLWSINFTENSDGSSNKLRTIRNSMMIFFYFMMDNLSYKYGNKI